MQKIVCFILFALFYSCSNPPYHGRNVVGADEFVIDSYKIREGKFAILQMQGTETESLSSVLLDEYKDLIHDGDILKIIVYHPSRTDLVQSIASIAESMGFKVSEKNVILPELGSIEVEGLTLDEARLKIQGKYREEIHDVDVFVDYEQRIQRKVELAGLVSIPLIPIDGRMRLYEALAVAKVPPNANLFKSYMIRDNALLPVDLYRLIKEGDMHQNIVLRGGDKIYIAEPSATSLMVLGEVGRERLVDLPNGFMTLRQALAEAGGIASTGDRSYIQVIRGNILHPKIYTLHWQHVIALPSDSMLLMPGDIVYVAATPITEWNRFVSQLLPTFIGLDLVTRGIHSIGINVP
ncbi:MAG: polysaccharide biosynthesis/export family protein [Anaplasmataceae bacterium]|nr:polysaccharide biosynthesis/export family protein [Anaplasmataceae bacterium]